MNKQKKIEVQMSFEDKPADKKKITIKLGRAMDSGFVRKLKDDQQLRFILLAGAVVVAIMIVYAIADGIKQMILL